MFETSSLCCFACIMCAGAIVEARIKRLVFGCFDQKRGAFGSLLDLNKLPLNHKVDVTGGVLRAPVSSLHSTE